MSRILLIRKTLLFVASVGPVFASTSGTRADICFEYGSGGFSIAIGAKVPAAPNACITASLVEQAVPGSRGGVATGSICRSEEGGSRPTLVFQYTYDSCTGPGSYFESATCRFDLEKNGDLPSQKPASQTSTCNGVFVGLLPGQSGQLRQFSDTTLKAWNCTPGAFAVPGGGGAQCFGRGLFSHPTGDETPTQRK
jgi:hypothetical protein